MKEALGLKPGGKGHCSWGQVFEFVLYCLLVVSRLGLDVGLEDLVLLVIYHGRDLGPHSALTTRIHKVLFLVWEGFRDLLNIPGPEKGPYGPYFRDVPRVLDVLVERGLVEVEESTRPREGPQDTGIVRIYRLTDRGRERAEEIVKKLEELGRRRFSVRASLARRLLGLIREASTIPLPELLATVYVFYPEYAEKSVIRERILKRLRRP